MVFKRDADYYEKQAQKYEKQANESFPRALADPNF